MGQLLSNTSLQTSSWPTVLSKPLLVSNTRNLSKDSVLFKKCSLSRHIVIHLSCICLASYFLCIWHHIFFFQTYFLTLVKRSCLRAATLPSQHALMFLLSAKYSKGTPPYLQFLTLLNDTQCARLKSPLLNTEASLLNLTECFDPLHVETTPGCRLLDSFPDCISFYSCNCSSLRDCKTHL